MCNRFEQAKALVQEVISRLPEIEKRYNDSLSKKNIDVSLQVGIKGVIDNLRSALDYVAYELYDRFGAKTGNDRVYFPIASKVARQNDFKSLVGKNIPNLPQRYPDMVSVLESFQYFTSSDNSWLPDLATLAIENKHKNLSPQMRKETRELRIQSGGCAVSIGGGSRIEIGRNALIQIGDMVIRGGQTIGPGSPPLRSGSGKVEDITWVSFEFTDIGQPALPFLKKSTDGVAKIIETIHGKIEGTKPI
jgi:hypothetical protein